MSLEIHLTFDRTAIFLRRVIGNEEKTEYFSPLGGLRRLVARVTKYIVEFFTMIENDKPHRLKEDEIGGSIEP